MKTKIYLLFFSSKCFKGFYLDEYDGRRCHGKHQISMIKKISFLLENFQLLTSDIDECSEDNFGCEQICHNLNGSAECRCHAGLAVDGENPKKCVGG
jgi:hypothetical protein